MKVNQKQYFVSYVGWIQIFSNCLYKLQMTDRIKVLEEDILELKKLLLDAERPHVQDFLAKHISALKTELDQLSSLKINQEPQKQAPPAPVSAPSKDIDKTSFQPLTKYAWDQDGPKVKLIFSLEGVGSQCTKEQVEVLFEKHSVEMRLKGYNGFNHIFAIKRLFGEIKPEECKFLLKNNGITIIMKKKDNKNWDQIQFKEEKFGKEKKEDLKEDPSAGIMNMMKKMYEEGDENTKRTIAEAWTKANDKKGEKPDFSDRYDFLNKK